MWRHRFVPVDGGYAAGHDNAITELLRPSGRPGRLRATYTGDHGVRHTLAALTPVLV